MITIRAINVCFRGNSHFFDSTKNIRAKIKNLENEGFNLTHEYFDKKIMDCAIFISCSKPNINNMKEGFIKVAYAPSNFREHIDPVLVDSDHDIYKGGTVMSIFRYTLEDDIWHVIEEFTKEKRSPLSI